MKKFIALLFLPLLALSSNACSTFLLARDGKYYFGRNYDWVSGNGIVMVNARAVRKTSYNPDGGKATSWISKYGSISFNQFGKDFPHGGMNEKGLVVELMWLVETKYPNTDARSEINELQWIQYQLDNCATIDEVIATDKVIRIGRNNAAPLHFLVADENGRAATIEFINGKMVAHKGDKLPYPVLTNTIYEDAVSRLKNKPVNQWTSFGDNSVDRFASACQMIQQFQQTNNNTDPVDYSFSILNKVAQGDYTKWSIVYDISGRQVHFVTNGNQHRKSFSLDDFDFSCNKAPLALAMGSSATGPVSKYFSPLTFSQNKAVIERSALESKTHVQLSAPTIAGIADYYNSVLCLN
ncbi:linear amide C-N hydrolase [Chitinophagaceae bacterium LB-8]|uniref:Linear amide C-N hydrolase n=1 Tax=Paraflavisolibacter caeni TaxID=2982496 RepID=A0A9X3BJ56_9BACT|nr:linear amide C-N hydrolase [Paraflavisolibacter caeni]MCU7552352.1 linear amide C-N hydrolase [Paraflavisolibacter caeni]